MLAYTHTTTHALPYTHTRSNTRTHTHTHTHTLPYICTYAHIYTYTYTYTYTLTSQHGSAFECFCRRVSAELSTQTQDLANYCVVSDYHDMLWDEQLTE
jgi:hypothetical protein